MVKVTILFGDLANGGRPTSEFPSHLMSRIERLKVNPEQRVVFHCHPTNLIIDLRKTRMNITYRLLYGKYRQSHVAFPEGIGVILRHNEIGKATAEKDGNFSAVIWPSWTLFASDLTPDETYGLVEILGKQP